MAVDEPVPLTMAAYGCVWPCASDTPNPKRLTYGRVHTPEIPALPVNPFQFLLTMAVYGRAHESYGRVRHHPCMTPL
eukprot:2308172-Pyramimonas_sp.AAC.1